MSLPLFRAQVLEAQRAQPLGGISLAQPLGLWVLAALAVVAAASVAALLVFGDYTRRSRVAGQLVPDLGVSTVLSPVNGVIGRLYAQEGERVLEDDALALIAVPRVTAAGADARAVVRRGLAARLESTQALGGSQARQIDAQLEGLSRQREAALRELAQLQDEIATRQRQVRMGEDTARRFEQLAESKFIGRIQLDQQRQAVLELLNAQQSLQRQASSLRRTLAQLDQALRELPAQREGALAAVRRDVALLQQEWVQHESDGERMVRAPVAGRVAHRLVEPGQSVQAGQALMTLLPAGSLLQAQLLVPSAGIGFVAPGDRVLLRYHAFPHQKFGHQGGVVLRVSRSAVTPPAAAGGAGGEPYYRVLVALDHQAITARGRAEPLRPGMQLDADLLGERRRLYEWVLEPLYSLRGKIGD